MTALVAFLVQRLWVSFFAVPIHVAHLRDYFFTGIAGGSGKTTAAAKAAGYWATSRHIRIDNFKYDAKWARNEHFGTDLRYAILGDNEDKIVLDGLFSDVKDPEHLAVVLEFINAKRDILLVRIDLPLVVTLWRKLFRSAKRALGWLPQGAAPESQRNVYQMLRNTCMRYNQYKKVLDEEWSQIEDKVETLHLKWPFYPVIVKP